MSFAFKSVYYDSPIQAGRILDLFVPEKITRKKCFFFVHGGGWRAGSRTIYHQIMEQLVDRGYVCASADYRLGVANAFMQIADLRKGYDIFLSELASLGVTQPEIIVHGSSAGAHLGLLFTLTRPGELGEGTEELRPRFIAPAAGVFQAVPIYFTPWPDIFPPIEVSMRDIAGAPYESEPDVYERLSPINYVKADSCPIFLMHASDEHMFPLWQSLDFQKKMKKFGRVCEIKTYTPAEHGFFYDVTRRVQQEAFADLLGFVDR